MNQKIVLSAAMAVFLGGCADIERLTEDNPSRLNEWQARNILGGGDNSQFDRFEGRVTSGQMVEAGPGSISPGRQP